MIVYIAAQEIAFRVPQNHDLSKVYRKIALAVEMGKVISPTANFMSKKSPNFISKKSPNFISKKSPN